jgi:transcriptional regulator with XRE-family HTH domain
MKTLRQFLEERGLTQRAFAASVPMSASHLSEILKGRKSPCLGVVVKMIRATDGEVQAEGLLPEHTLKANSAALVQKDRSAPHGIGSADE